MVSKDDTIKDREALVQMYQAGFYDGAKLGLIPKTLKEYKAFNAACRVAFEMRFFKKIEKRINTLIKNKKNNKVSSS